MPHFLCFSDLTLARSNPNSSAKENNCLIDSSTQTIDTSAPADEINQHPTAVFVREDNKKSSFVLQQPYALLYAPGNKVQNEHKVPNLPLVPVDDGINADEVLGHTINEDQHGEKSDVEKLDWAPANGCGKETAMAATSITSCIFSEPPKITPQAKETFLFGGFELITNVKTVEVYVSKTAKPEEESYLTTCKGIPMRDLPDLTTTPLHVDGTRGEGESTSVENRDANCNIGGLEETTNAIDEGTIKSEERDTFYKFILVSPGGPKPLERVKLNFVKSNASFVHGNSIIVRTLKVKGRLSDSIPTSNTSRQSMPQPSLPVDIASFNPGILNNERKGNMNNISSMMSMMGGNGMMGMPMAMQMSPHYQLTNQLQMQSPTQQQQQQQQNNQQQEKNQAEIISSVAGLGMFLKSSEERTMNKLEAMLTKMENRIMTRLDGLAERLGVIEQSINESNIELSPQK